MHMVLHGMQDIQVTRTFCNWHCFASGPLRLQNIVAALAVTLPSGTVALTRKSSCRPLVNDYEDSLGSP